MSARELAEDDNMTSAQVTAEVFWAAFISMKEGERQAFLEHLIADQRLREDLLDAALIEQRRLEPRRPLKDALGDRTPSKARR
jgi:hypothetical protein